MRANRSQIFQKKVVAQPGNLLFQFSYAQALFEEEDFQGAIAPLEVCLGQRSDWMIARILLGRCHLALGDAEGARKELVAARELAIEQHHDDPLSEVEALLEGLG